MKPASTDDIRQAFLDFFESKGHTIIPGAPLVPENDPTVLFTTAGMHPLVPYLLGEPHPGGKRIADCQKCIRTQDIDEVGDESHLTMFEMLGNWSLGDYFKEEAIKMSFEFLTEVLEIPKEKLAITCFRGDNDAPKDEEAAEFWMGVGIPEERIGFLPKEDNWWGPAGQTGPCGPDTEMFVWMNEDDPKGNPETHPYGWMEVWNDVFMQYNKQPRSSGNRDDNRSQQQSHNRDSEIAASGEAGDEMKFVPLKQKNVDTGMGLERVAAVMQECGNVYETDCLQSIMDRVKSLADAEGLKHQRIITDHIKAAAFIIADGILPSNVDQGYVLRRLIRRAIRSGRYLKIEHDGTFTPTIADEVIKQYSSVYGNLKEKEKEIRDALSGEELQFGKTLKEGMKQFEKAVEKASTEIDGVTAFHLYDTYGFPLELTKELAGEEGLKVDEKGFKQSFEEHQKLSRAGAEQRFSGGLADQSSETTKLHTATHLLNAALRKVLGDHVYQKGSNITADRLRFDFSHPEKMTKEQIAEVEKLVNEAIEADLPIKYHVTDVEGAKKEGAIGVFDERYGNEVKVYVIGKNDCDKDNAECAVGAQRAVPVQSPFSIEICGGPHVASTSMIGKFKIKKEESSSSGVRRIKAVVEGGTENIEIAEEDK
ncbi:MAG: alanine--tRNA ligase-related protein [Candidatus Peribacteraceae bacterium]|jgi:alanyl-tRNA synthetase|nr:alanine--tRNA ligase-related protein [Candidatus Peribacteraceae bacterium]MDP7645954.1 alanine--tRNA ligase-related protein [Candidatus Peribacteraceae bacterium]